MNLWPEKILGPVLKVLESCCLREIWDWGSLEEDTRLTLVIVAEDKGRHQWDVLTPRILEICVIRGATYWISAVTEGRHF